MSRKSESLASVSGLLDGKTAPPEACSSLTAWNRYLVEATHRRAPALRGFALSSDQEDCEIWRADYFQGGDNGDGMSTVVLDRKSRKMSVSVDLL